MNGVSCRALGLILDGSKSGDLSLDQLTSGLGVTPKFLSDPSNQISWDVLVAITDRLADQLGGPDALRQFGEDNIATDTFGIFKAVGRVLSHPRDIYFMGVRWMGPSLFPMVTAKMTERPDGVLVQQLTIEDGHRDCPSLFYVLQGCLAAAPVALGHGYSNVEIQLEPGRATYLIHPRTSSSGRAGRVFRAIRARFLFPSMLRELENQQAEIEDSYHELREAHDKISAQASDLTQVNAIGQRLSEHIDLPRLVDVLIRIMLNELGILGVELRLAHAEVASPPIDPSGGIEPRLIRKTGQTEGPASRTYLLEAAAQPLGTLKVWHAQNEQEAADAALLERLIPWIAMSLDNARTYEALERHAAALEQRVNERTARLLAANHHLVREIDERQRATEALLESETQLRASERLASIGTLAAGIAHEINNPVGCILAAAQYAQIVRHDENAEIQVADSLDTIVEQAKRCGEIVRSVLQFSRDEPTQKWTCELNNVVRRSIKLAEAFAEENHAQIVIDLPKESAWANVNPIQIEQALVNLIRNAVESGATRIDVGVREERDRQLAMIVVRDDGPGVDPSDRSRIFEPFYTTKQSVGGTGLGLSVVHGIAAEHGGSLRIDDSDDRGTTILLELPTCSAPANPLADKPDNDDPA